VGEAGIIAPHVPPTPVQELLQMGMGVDGFAFALQDFRAEVEALMEEMHRKNLAVYEIVARSPVEVVILCENTSTRMISPAIYERYSLGHVRDFVELMHRHGKVAVVHMCGHIRGLLSLIAQTGLDGIDALTPPPTGNTTPQEAWQVIGDHLVVHGVWDPTRWLTCPEADLERNLLATLDGLRGRPYLLCSAADGLAGIPRERFAAVARLVAHHGAPW
jgi:uroporphyrinogen-III decarboxylase